MEIKGMKMELKTPTPGVTRTERIKTGFGTVSEYTKYLQGKYSYVNTGKVFMQGIPTTVSVSGAFLKKCMKDPEKAKYLEENLAAIPDCVKSLANFTKTMPGSPVCTYAAYVIGDDGNITFMGGCTNDSDGKIKRENAQRRAKEKKAEEEREAKKRMQKKAEEERRQENRTQKKEEKAGLTSGIRTIRVTGTSIESVTGRVIGELISETAAAESAPNTFDIKA